jgi:3-dehydroquinate synthase class II
VPISIDNTTQSKRVNQERQTMVSRIYVEKKPGFDVEAQQLLAELRTILGRAASPAFAS